MLNREWGAENEKLPHLFIPGKTAGLVPEFEVEDLPLDRNATLVLAFAVKDCLWAENSDIRTYVRAYSCQNKKCRSVEE